MQLIFRTTQLSKCSLTPHQTFFFTSLITIDIQPLPSHSTLTMIQHYIAQRAGENGIPHKWRRYWRNPCIYELYNFSKKIKNASPLYFQGFEALNQNAADRNRTGTGD